MIVCLLYIYAEQPPNACNESTSTLGISVAKLSFAFVIMFETSSVVQLLVVLLLSLGMKQRSQLRHMRQNLWPPNVFLRAGLETHWQLLIGLEQGILQSKIDCQG